jgi:RNA polymerase sigma-70 factor (ECF subfamily)
MYGAHGSALRTFVHRRVDPSVADDVVADVLLVAWRRFDDVPADSLPWLFGIARGVLANQRRGQTRRAALHDRLTSTSRPDLSDPGSAMAAELSPVLAACASLSVRDQEVLLLVAWDGLERDQAARVLGITSAQFAVRLHRARRRLQRALEAAPSSLPTSDRRSVSEVP